MDNAAALIRIEVDESMLSGWVTSEGPGGTARFVNTLEAAGAHRAARGFTLGKCVEALNAAAEQKGWPFEFAAHKSTYNGAARVDPEAWEEWEEEIMELLENVPGQLAEAAR